MKRLLTICLILIICCVSFHAAAEENPGVFSYEFDFTFHMNAQAFPARDRAHMQGYADLANMLRLRGSLVWNPAADSLDLTGSLIPVTNPDAAILFRFWGTQNDMGLTSPILGNETLWFQNVSLMEFAYKTWNNLRIPLQYVTLLTPYVTRQAFAQLSNAWDSCFGDIRKSRTVSYKKELIPLSESWDAIVRGDSRLSYWIYSLSLPVRGGNVMEEEFARLPDYLLTRVAGKADLKATVKKGAVTWTNKQGDVLFTRTEGPEADEWALSLPPTENGYLPLAAFRSSREEDRLSLSLQASYNLSEEAAAAPESALPESLISLSFSAEGLPARWPMDTEFSASLTIGGILYPNAELTLRGAGTQKGDIDLTISRPMGSRKESMEFLSVRGTLIPVEPAVIPAYTRDDLASHLSIFNVSDLTMDDFVHRIRRPLFFGILNFLNELPARSCQSVMDDLEDYGVLDMVLVD